MKKKTIPTFQTDEEAERFVETENLSDYDLSGFKPVRFRLEGKMAHFDLSVPQSLLDAARDRAKARGVPFARYIRELLERDVSMP